MLTVALSTTTTNSLPLRPWWGWGEHILSGVQNHLEKLVFGTMSVLDDELTVTEGPGFVGKAQG